MLPTPDTSHVPYSRVYEPAEDSFLMIDTLALPAETAFLTQRFGGGDDGDAGDAGTEKTPPLVVEIGSGSGVVLAFVAAQAAHLFGPSGSPLALAVDVNEFACAATRETARRAIGEERADAKKRGDRTERSTGTFLGAVRADLVAVLRPGQVDVLLFNPPYVPTPSVPANDNCAAAAAADDSADAVFARDSHLLELAYAGGHDGMETTDRLLAALPDVLSARGCAYILLCAQNRPEAVKQRIRAWPVAGDGGGGEKSWHAETVGSSGKQAGWEKLQIVRIWRE
ncbi:S-adenosylmethionine-dependent methyltransferase [Sporothrix curviconia]|uniref:S-adenosylmethionine-dependent methyltransferase n=1 Tax=Sporothrix curviconia TaxID=1260050 RepID=A0ABP0B4D0_9PEZI